MEGWLSHEVENIKEHKQDHKHTFIHKSREDY